MAYVIRGPTRTLFWTNATFVLTLGVCSLILCLRVHLRVCALGTDGARFFQGFACRPFFLVRDGQEEGFRGIEGS